MLQFLGERMERPIKHTSSTDQEAMKIEVNINLGDIPTHAVQVLAANRNYNRFADRWQRRRPISRFLIKVS